LALDKVIATSGGFKLGPGGAQAPKSCPAPKFLNGSIVISLSRCCLLNDEGPSPPSQIFFLEPPLIATICRLTFFDPPCSVSILFPT